MKFLENINLSCINGDYEVVIKLGEGWKNAVRKFPIDRINEILKPSVDFAQRCVQELKEIVELTPSSTYGLMHISLIPERAGLDLFPDQNAYISHNFTNKMQILGVLPVVIDYLKLLESV